MHAWLDGLFPQDGKYNLAVRPYQVVVAFSDVGSDDFHVGEGLLDHIFDALCVDGYLPQSLHGMRRLIGRKYT